MNYISLQRNVTLFLFHGGVSKIVCIHFHYATPVARNPIQRTVTTYLTLIVRTRDVAIRATPYIALYYPFRLA